jgi:hypothetical protein
MNCLRFTASPSRIFSYVDKSAAGSLEENPMQYMTTLTEGGSTNNGILALADANSSGRVSATKEFGGMWVAASCSLAHAETQR